jgi:hypothetical protein
MTQLPTTPYLDHPRPRKIVVDVDGEEKYVGGTLIAAHIVTLEQHAAAVANPDLIRPSTCLACAWSVLHVHDRRTRKLDGLGSESTVILIFRCARESCRVVWRVLPKLLARHLWRAWERIGEALDDARERSSTPKPTRQRWRRRLRERATTLVVVLGQLGPARERAVAELTIDAMRREVIAAFDGLARLAELAALVDRLVPGVRVM